MTVHQLHARGHLTGSIPAGGCITGFGWVSAGRTVAPPVPVNNCTDPGCLPNTNDASWRVLNVPHDFVVENNFSESASKSQGYLPFGKAWYRKHMTFPESAKVRWLSVAHASARVQRFHTLPFTLVSLYVVFQSLLRIVHV